jgi:putative membrane protein insertion efficiency factor
MTWFLKKMIVGYQYVISPYVGVCCRFEPTCSHYTVQAIDKHGLVKGLFLGIGRLLKCHPFHSGGLDPVP